jgi:tetratricopeptide (TPR) repeat protein
VSYRYKGKRFYEEIKKNAIFEKKMKTMKNFVIIILTTLLATGCASSKKALQRGEYHRAVMEAVKTLRSSPNNKNATETLLLAYPLAKENGLRRIQNVMMADMPGKHITAADEYIELNQIAEAIYSCPKALALIPYPEQFSKELSSIIPLATEEAYRFGEDYLRDNTIQGAQDAYYYFSKANQYQYGYRDVLSKMEISLQMATFKVVVTRPVLPNKYQLTADFFYNNLMEKLSQVEGKRFLHFFSQEEANRERLQWPNHTIVLNFDDFSVGNMRESKNTIQLSRDSVLVGTTTVNGRQQNVYGTVKATLEVFRREVTAEGALSIRIINPATNRVEAQRSVPGKFVWINEWASYKGDERALSDKEKKMTNSKPMMPPSQQDLFIEFTKPIFDRTLSFIRSHYSKFP